MLIQAGWRAIPAKATQIEFAPYAYFISRYIQFDLINFVAYNIDRAKIYGAEFELSQDFGGGLVGLRQLHLSEEPDRGGDPFVALFVDLQDRGLRPDPGTARA